MNKDRRAMIRLEPELDDWLEELKKKHNISKSSLVRLRIMSCKQTGFTVDIKGEQ